MPPVSEKGKCMPALFESTEINGMTLKNRFVRSATYEGMAEPDGQVTDELLDCMAELARGEVGLIISGHAYVIREGQAGPRQMGLYSDELIDGLKQMASVVHDNGGRIAAQLAHAGKWGIGKGAFAPLSSSDVMADEVQTATAMTSADIERTVKAFGDAARRAVDAGFDAVQIHSAHGYLLTQFLSPFYNRRADEYGGSLENRARLLIEVYEEIRKQVGPEFPVLVKINSEDFVEGGMTSEEMLQVSRWLEERGVDAIEMSGGTFDSGNLGPVRTGACESEEQEVFYRSVAEAFKKEIGVPLILVGGFLSFSLAEQAVTSGLTDYVALCRPLIREPHLIKRWAAGETQKATCITCNRCFKVMLVGKTIHCPIEKRAQKQAG